MKIALFSDTYLPDINGVATSTNILRNELVRLGHDVLVVTSELPSDSDYDISLDDQILRVPGLEIQALYGYRACNIFSFKGMKEICTGGYSCTNRIWNWYLWTYCWRIFRSSSCLHVSYNVDRLFALCESYQF